MDHKSFKFSPRGIIKWHPFNAVDDTIAVQYELDKINNIKPQPELSSDQLEELQNALEYAYYGKHIITIHYYMDNAIQTITGNVNKIDNIEKSVFINNIKVAVKYICYILTENGSVKNEI